MSSIVTFDSTEEDVRESSDSHALLDRICWGLFAKILIGIVAVYAVARIYLHEYAFTVGLDYFEPEFATYLDAAVLVQHRRLYRRLTRHQLLPVANAGTRF